jgi:putative phosphoribosyl transferase
MRFINRQDAGLMLAEELAVYKNASCVVCALPRGGVVLGKVIAESLEVPLGLIIPRKIGHPTYPEYAVCAVTEDGHLVCTQDEIARLEPEWLKQSIIEAQGEARRRRELYLNHRKPVTTEGKTVIITDDGVATGLTMLAAIQSAKDNKPIRIIVAVPVMPLEVYSVLQKYVDDIVVLDVTDHFLGGVGAYYTEFEQVEDEEVIKLLE